jgi:predicted component of type VI protein secretion system
MAMKVFLPSSGTHSWLRCFERRMQVRLGTLNAGERIRNLPLHILQRVGFSCEPRAVWRSASPQESASLVWNDYGLLGPDGPLPMQFTERLLHARQGHAVLRLIDGLSQRLAHLHYRAWAQHRPECEWGHSDNRLAILLGKLCGDVDTPFPYFAWARPPLSHLPMLAKQRLGLHVRVRCEWSGQAVNDLPACLGDVRLGTACIGRQVRVAGSVSRRVRVSASPATSTQYEELRSLGSILRRRLDGLIRACTASGSHVCLSIHPPVDLPAGTLGRSRLGAMRAGKPVRHPAAIGQFALSPGINHLPEALCS